jgi:SagB-type dehydrogenase family enzyme
MTSSRQRPGRAAPDPALDVEIERARARIPDGARRAGWHPLAALFHFGTHGLPYLEGAGVAAYEAWLEARQARDPAPPPFKAATGRGTPLRRRAHAGEFTGVLLARRTWRGFGRAALRNADLGSLLDLTFGCRMSGLRQGTPVVFKTSPSGGACHPIEAYVLALRVSGLPPALYHYSPATRRLHRVRRGAAPALASRYLAGQAWCGAAGAIVFLTAMLPRAWWRYPGARTYRAVLIEAGHVCQTFCLVSTWLGLAPFCTMAIDEPLVERHLKLDPTREVLLYAAGVGTRPKDGRWVQWPGYRPDVNLPR